MIKILRYYVHTQMFFKFNKAQSFYSKITNTYLIIWINHKISYCDNVVVIEETMKEYKYFLCLKTNE